MSTTRETTAVRPARPPRSRWGRRVAGAAVAAAALAPVLAAPSAEAIVGGVSSGPGNLTYVAQINNTVAGGQCTGSLVHPSWVLTAAHCSVPASTGDMTVRVGNSSSGTGGQFRRVAQILRHPSYTGGHNDVALLQLSSPVTNIAPARLGAPAQAGYWDGVGSGVFTQYDEGTAVGWGRTSSGSLPTTLQQRIVSILPQQSDAQGIGYIPINGGTCQGDSGGPLLVTVNGVQVVAGIVKSANCGTGGTYSIVGTGSNRDWILSKITAQPYTSFGVKDWDGDGHQDIVARQNSTGDLWLYPGQSVRGYSSIQRVRIGNGWNGFTPFGVTDWDRDGKQDIVVRNDTTGDLMLYPGQGLRSPSAIYPVQIGNGYDAYTPFGAGDWNRDGHQDLVARNDVTGALMLFRGQSVRGYSALPPTTIGTGWNSISPSGLADWERDGHQDLVVRSNVNGDLLVYRGQSLTTPSSFAPVKIGNGYSGLTGFGATDYDRDGHQDLVSRIDANGDLMLYPGQSVLGYSSATPVRIGNGW